MYTNKYNYLSEIIIYPMAIAIILLLNLNIIKQGRPDNSNQQSNKDTMTVYEELVSTYIPNDISDNQINDTKYGNEELVSISTVITPLASAPKVNILHKTPDEKVIMYNEDEQYKMYSIKDINLIDSLKYNTSSYTISRNEEIRVIGKVESHPGYILVATNDNNTGYIQSMDLCKEEVIGATGPLTYMKGAVLGPNGKETYYDLPMDRIVANARAKGYTEEEYPFWIREDGCKMLGDYIMVAADLDIHPRYSIVETSLGLGIVCDTGGFAEINQYQFDIATDWTDRDGK